MEKILRELTLSMASNRCLMPPPYQQDQPLDLSEKKQKIVVTSSQLQHLEITAENRMPCTKKLLHNILMPIIDGQSKTREHLHNVPVTNNSWQLIKSLLMLPTIEFEPELTNVAAQESVEFINVTDVTAEEISAPKIAKNKRQRCSLDNSERAKLEHSFENQCPELVDNDGVSERIVIGPNGTTIARKDWNIINWRLSAAAITRKLLMAVFDRHTLAHHTLSGKPSPAFIDCNKPEKGKLNPTMVEDIIIFMTTHFEIKDHDVKCAITSKCADEAKSRRQRLSLSGDF